MAKFIIAFVIIIVLVIAWYFINSEKDQQTSPVNIISDNLSKISATPTPKSVSLPQTKVLNNDYHVFQSFNNCGPAALSMALSYYGINISQETLGQSLRPYQVPGGDNDDKSVTLEELAEKSKEYGLIPYHRPNGDISKVKEFIANGLPVITRTYLKEGEDIGHYRVIKGYDDATQEFIQDDSLQGKNLRYQYTDFNNLWEDFNFEYLVLTPEDKKDTVERILGEDVDNKKAWQKTVNTLQKNLESNPNDVVTLFNLSVALFNIGDYTGATEAFEKVEDKLSMRTLWYQIEPIQAYYELGKYDRVLEITDKILNNHNRAFSELYYLRGLVYQKQGNIDQARDEFDKAVLYNRNFSSKIPKI